MFFDKVSLVTGGFDPIHSGHIAYFKRAKDLSNYDEVAIDLETTSLNTQDSSIVGISFSVIQHKAFYIPISQKTLEPNI